MNTKSEVAVTLTPGLFARLREEAAQLGVPIEWLVASLVADTLDEAGVPPARA